MKKIDLNIKDVYCVGDIHGNFDAINGLIKGALNTPKLNDCAIIFCGDIGFGFEKYAYYKQKFKILEKICDKQNVYCIFVRGNHDDPSYFDGNKINYPHIMAVEDYTVISANSNNILCVGGAISIDRAYRVIRANQSVENYKRYHHKELSSETEQYLRRGYWTNEAPIYDENKLKEITDNNINIDFICTHTCPDYCQPITKDGISYWMIKDAELDEDTTNERIVMTNIKNYLINNNHNLSKWIYGHFHYHNEEIIDNISYIMLDMDRNGKMDIYKLI